MKAMRRQLDEAEEEISREKAHRRKVSANQKRKRFFEKEYYLVVEYYRVLE
jgi:hypothetical protein